MLERDRDVLDVRSFDFGLPDLNAYLPALDDRQRETRRTQQRVLRAWELRRKELHQRIHADPEEISNWQLERVALLVDNVYSTNRFYHELYKSVGFRTGDILSWDDYHALPTIDKQDILENFEAFTGSNVLDYLEYYHSRTSGSSGQILTRYQNEAYVDYKMLIYLRYWEQLLGRERRHDEWLYEIYFQHQAFTSFDRQYPIFTLSLDCPPELALQHIKRMRPIILTTFPSYLLRLSELGVDLKEHGVAAMVTNSEGSTRREREEIARRLGVPVYDEYSTEELSFIAAEGPCHRYHIVEDNVHVSALQPDKDGLGQVVITGFMNTFLPFIRYRQGDLVELGPQGERCVCGNNFRTLTRFLGRADQCLRKPGGGVITSDRIMNLYDRVLIPRSAKVDEFHILQTDLEHLDIFVRPTGGLTVPDPGAMSIFVRELKNLFGEPSPEIRLRPFDEMPSNLSRKRRLITSFLSTKDD